MVDPVDPPADMWDRIRAGVAVSERSAALAAGGIADDIIRRAASVPTRPIAPSVKSGTGVAEGSTLSVEPPGEPVALAPSQAPAPTARAGRSESFAPPESPGALPRVRAAPAQPQPVPPVTTQPSRAVLRFQARVRRWRTATALAGSLAACLFALIVLQLTNPDLLPGPLQPRAKVVEVTRTVEVPSPKPAEFVAVLQRDASSPAFLLTFDLDKRQLTVRTVGAERQAGKSYELWLVSDKFSAPRSLGVIGAAPYTVRQPEPDYDPVIINRATYAVSLEPEGGSPTGAPTGPVLYSGKLMQATAPEFPARTP
jgi:hypothetical protein